MMWRISPINQFSDIIFSQGNVATRLGCGGIFNDHFIGNFQQIVTVKEFWKSARIWWSYAWNTPDSFFSGHGVLFDFLTFILMLSDMMLYCACSSFTISVRCDQSISTVLLCTCTAERTVASGKEWHKHCFTCTQCGKILHPGKHSEV